MSESSLFRGPDFQKTRCPQCREVFVQPVTTPKPRLELFPAFGGAIVGEIIVSGFTDDRQTLFIAGIGSFTLAVGMQVWIWRREVKRWRERLDNVD